MVFVKKVQRRNYIFGRYANFNERGTNSEINILRPAPVTGGSFKVEYFSACDLRNLAQTSEKSRRDCDYKSII